MPSISMTLGQFATRIRKVGPAIDGAMNKHGAQVGIVVGKSLADLTPVDTGAAKSNWRATFYSPARAVRGAHFPGKYASTDDANTQASIAEIVAKFSTRKKNAPMFLSNGLPYISLLESSYNQIKRKISPPDAKYRSHFVKVSVDRGEQEARKVRGITKAIVKVLR